MAPRTLLTALALTAVVASPAIAQDNQRQRSREQAQQSRDNGRQAQQPAPQARDRAVERSAPPRGNDQARQNDQARRQNDARQNDVRQNEARQNEARQNEARQNNSRQYDNRQSNSRQYDNRQYDNRRYDNNNRYENRAYASRRYAPRIVNPVVIRVAPYRPYVYRPSYGIGVYYGSGGYYPYGETPRGYYDPIPGRFYGGVRITGAPRDAQVFADGYYVGIVNDFDGIFQHMNLEAGRHHIEIEWGNSEPVAFDVYVRPGETTTFRADGYFRY